MPRIYVLSATSTRHRASKRRVGVAVVLASIIALGAASIASFDRFFPHALEQASANVPLLHTATPPGDESSRGSDRGFDYFPDQFINQAKEPAEPIATF